MVHADRGPLQRLAIHVLQALEAAAGQEVGLDGPKAALFTGLAIRVADLVADASSTASTAGWR